MIPLLLGIVILLPVTFLATRRTLDNYSRAGFQRDRQRCQWILKSNLHFQVCYRYRLEHDNTFPPDLKTAFWESEMHLAPDSPSSAIFLKCPGSGTKQGLLIDAEEWQDYIYINWSLYYGAQPVPPDYPLIYDRRLSNHDGKGINVVSVEGAVR